MGFVSAPIYTFQLVKVQSLLLHRSILIIPHSRWTVCIVASISKFLFNATISEEFAHFVAPILLLPLSITQISFFFLFLNRSEIVIEIWISKAQNHIVMLLRNLHFICCYVLSVALIATFGWLGDFAR